MKYRLMHNGAISATDPVWSRLSELLIEKGESEAILEVNQSSDIILVGQMLDASIDKSIWWKLEKL